MSLAPPVFDEKVQAMPPREAAAEMGHALRFHLEERVKRQDPEKYTRLSERLEEILRELPGRFEEQIEEFGRLIEQARQEDPALAGLSPLEQRVYRLLQKLLEGNPGVARSAQDLRPVVGAVCDTAGRTMAKASYQGQHQDVGRLAHAHPDPHAILLPGGGGVPWRTWRASSPSPPVSWASASIDQAGGAGFHGSAAT